ncbi:MAG TPA: nuclear transport factor 2 family protein [Pseudolysinimonas sp.]|nr:nuclear transport factor 2 family protein [Pseudolysinimonas sp.]
MTTPAPALSADDRIAIHELTTAYGVHHDQLDFESLHACFTADASYLMKVADGTVHGPRLGADAIISQIKTFKASQTDRRRHHISNIQVSARDANTAEVTSYVLVSAVADQQLSLITVGTYTDVVTRTADGWRISEKVLQLDTTF